jgi:putative peptidoglycan lipid II flippase
MNLLRSVGTIGGLTLVSRLFGFVRDMMIARVLGAGVAGDAWQLAFQLPNIFRRLFAEGAFSAAFVPLFNRRMAEAGESDADKRHAASQTFATEVLSILLPLLVGFSALAMIAMPGVVWLIDDFGQGGRTNDFTITLARITFPYLIFISVMTVFAAILNSISRFAAAAAAPVLLNLCIIGALLIVLATDGGADPRRAAYFVGTAAALSGFLQMAWLFFWVRRAGFRFRLHRPRLSPDVRKLGVLIIPAIFGAGVYQLSRFLDLFFLGRLPEGSFTYLAMADRLPCVSFPASSPPATCTSAITWARSATGCACRRTWPERPASISWPTCTRFPCRTMPAELSATRARWSRRWSPAASIPIVRCCSTRRRCPPMPSCNGCSTAPRGWAG